MEVKSGYQEIWVSEFGNTLSLGYYLCVRRIHFRLDIFKWIFFAQDSAAEVKEGRRVFLSGFLGFLCPIPQPP